VGEAGFGYVEVSSGHRRPHGKSADELVSGAEHRMVPSGSPMSCGAGTHLEDAIARVLRTELPRHYHQRDIIDAIT